MQKTVMLLALAFSLSGCAIVSRTPPAIGDPLATVQAKFGMPTAVFPAPSGTVLEYRSGPMGQFTWMAQMGPDGRLVAFDQVHSADGFGKIKIDSATKDDVLRTIGRPAETSYLSLPDLQVWSYRYKESGVWNSMMHVHFDKAGIVRMMQNGPDPMYEEKRFFRD